MTKVEELRDDLDELIESSAAKVLTKDQFLDLPGFDKIVLALIAAAEAQGEAKGRAEGAEAERERIWAERGRIGGEHGNWVNIPESAFRRPLLAPAPKEAPNYYAVGDKGETGESHS